MTRNGAQLLLETLLHNGVDVVFGNPGTSEMQFVAALDAAPQMRAVLGLFEGVVTGAADGYGRMADKPAATLLHLGPGLANGLANLHNARRAHTPIVNVVGEHATFHQLYDPPLHSDVESIAAGACAWTRRMSSLGAVADDAAAAVGASMEAPGKVAALILPADIAWGEAVGAPKKAAASPPPVPAQATIDAVAEALRSGEPAAILVDGRATRDRALRVAGRIARQVGARVLCDTFPARLERGAGRLPVERLPYLPQMVLSLLAGVRHLVLVGARAPVSFFAYPGGPSSAVPEGCKVHTLAGEAEDVQAALEALADVLGAGEEGAVQPLLMSPAPTGGAIESDSLGAAVGATMPEGTIVVDESNTAGILIPMSTAGCPSHDWLCLTGGSIGMGLPAATGAALACPDRRVLAVDGDGSAVYTIQALWTQAREQLRVTNLILANRSYAILNLEMLRMGLGTPGPAAKRMLDLTNPTIDFVGVAQSLGVPATRVTAADELVTALRRSFEAEGPTLIEAVM